MKALGIGSIAIVTAALVGIATAQAPQQPSPQQPPQQQPSQQQPSQRSPQRQMPSKQQMPSRPMPASQAAHDPATLRDIEATMGFVPQWMRSVPVQMLPSFWQTIKTFQLSDETTLSRKNKELIGLAVAAQIPCTYCVQFHTEAARMHGASEQEIREAVGMAAVTREASTLLNGMMVDSAQFKRDLDRTMRQSRQQARK